MCLESVSPRGRGTTHPVGLTEVLNVQGHLLPWALTQSSVFMSQVHWTKGPDDSQHQSRSVQLEGGRRKAKGGNKGGGLG